MIPSCPHRLGDMCVKIVGPDANVTATMCAACPFTVIGCVHLRLTLVKVGGAVQLRRAACAERVIDVPGVETCGGCRERVAVRLEDVRPVERRDGKIIQFRWKWVQMEG